jgi:XTP/dITP diphosphohydrolase
MKLVFATTNPHKADEIREILGPFGVSVQALSDVSKRVPEPKENAETLEGNARLKAIAYATALGMVCLADDSGLEVEALGGAPGVHSARYAGVEGTRAERDQANRNKLVAELETLGAVDRTARLVCTLCLADSQGNVLFETRGAAVARVVSEARGGQGFGYDAHLYLPDVGKTIAELSAEEWNARSHRGAAARALAEWLTKNAR